MQNRHVRLIVLVALVGLMMAAGLQSAVAQYEQVSILAQWPSQAEQADFQALLLPFFREYNVQPNLISAANLEQTLQQQIEAGTPPDMVLLSKPGLLRPYAEAGELFDLGAALGPPPRGYPAYLAAAATVDGVEYGRAVRLTVKGLAWTNLTLFSRLGYTIPTTWDAMIQQAVMMARDGTPPWAFGASSSVIAGDVIETILYQLHGPDVLDGLVAGSIPWTDPRVREAWEYFGEILDTGTLGEPAQLAPVDAALAPFSSPPGAFVNLGPSTVLRWITNEGVSVQDVAFFVLPASSNPQRVIAGADYIVVLNESPITLQLAEYLAAPDTAAAWAQAGSAISPYAGASYPDAVMTEIAALISGGEPAFDLSDRLRSNVCAAFYAGIGRFLAERDALDDILIEIETVALQ